MSKCALCSRCALKKIRQSASKQDDHKPHHNQHHRPSINRQTPTIRLMVSRIYYGVNTPPIGSCSGFIGSQRTPILTGYQRLGLTEVEVDKDARFYSNSISTTSRCYCRSNVDKKIEKLIELDHTSLHSCCYMHILAIQNIAASIAIPKYHLNYHC